MRQSGRNASMIEPNSQSRLGSGQAVSRRKGMVALRDYAGAWRHASGPEEKSSGSCRCCSAVRKSSHSYMVQHYSGK